jgi:rod shape determining protein RodA
MMRGQKNIFHNTDWFIVVIYLILVFAGWLNIYAAVYDEDHASILDFHQQYGKQMIWIIAALVLALVTLLIDGKFFSQFAYLIYSIGIFVLIVIIFTGKEISGSKSWFQIGGMALQPAEFAKMATALALARYLNGLDIAIKKTRTLLTSAAIILLPAILVLLQHDTGSAIVFLALVLVLYRAGMPEQLMLFLVAVPVVAVLALVINQYIIIGGLVVVAVLVYLSTQRRIKNIVYVSLLLLFFSGMTLSVQYGFENVLEPHQKTRINVLFGKQKDLKGAGYNVNQSLIAIGSGGLTGKGFLQGTQTKYNFVPEQSTDFIFCTVGEEWGFLGSALLVALYLVLLLRIVLLAERQRSKFSRLYGHGVAAILFFHFAINIGMALGLLPVIGIPLPFFSYGGSSLWAFTILLFIFIRQDSYRYELL